MGIKERTIKCDAVEHDVDEEIPFMIEHRNNNLFQLRIKGGSIF
jgi:hypothetical protein